MNDDRSNFDNVDELAPTNINAGGNAEPSEHRAEFGDVAKLSANDLETWEGIIDRYLERNSEVVPDASSDQQETQVAEIKSDIGMG